MAEIREQFSALNGHIATAITNKDFNRAVTLDQARQDILKDLCLMDMSGIDESFFAFIEQCAKENAELIETIEKEMEHLTFHQSRTRKAQVAYTCLLYTSPSPRDRTRSRMPSSA